MSKNIFQAPAILTRIAYLKDNGLSLGFSTNELSHEEKIIASEFYGKFGYVLFAENQFKESDIPDTDASDESKSPSQRLRAALFVLWKQRGEKGDFEQFYRQQMEKAINRVKGLLD
jgi:hypothetical protein